MKKNKKPVEKETLYFYRYDDPQCKCGNNVFKHHNNFIEIPNGEYNKYKCKHCHRMIEIY